MALAFLRSVSGLPPDFNALQSGSTTQVRIVLRKSVKVACLTALRHAVTNAVRILTSSVVLNVHFLPSSQEGVSPSGRPHQRSASMLKQTAWTRRISLSKRGTDQSAREIYRRDIETQLTVRKAQHTSDCLCMQGCQAWLFSQLN